MALNRDPLVAGAAAVDHDGASACRAGKTTLPVGPMRHSRRMLSLIISALVLVATFLQTKVAAKESGDAHRAAMDVWNIEDELIAEQRFWWRRRAARRELKGMRDQETAKSIKHVETVLISWALLLLASAAALIGAVVEFVRSL